MRDQDLREDDRLRFTDGESIDGQHLWKRMRNGEVDPDAVRLLAVMGDEQAQRLFADESLSTLTFENEGVALNSINVEKSLMPRVEALGEEAVRRVVAAGLHALEGKYEELGFESDGFVHSVVKVLELRLFHPDDAALREVDPRHISYELVDLSDHARTEGEMFRPFFDADDGYDLDEIREHLPEVYARLFPNGHEGLPLDDDQEICAEEVARQGLRCHAYAALFSAVKGVFWDVPGLNTFDHKGAKKSGLSMMGYQACSFLARLSELYITRLDHIRGLFEMGLVRLLPTLREDLTPWVWGEGDPVEQRMLQRKHDEVRFELTSKLSDSSEESPDEDGSL